MTGDEDPEAKPPSGDSVLKASYLESLNDSLPGFDYEIARDDSGSRGRLFQLRNQSIRLRNNATYELTFYCKGSGLGNSEWRIEVEGVTQVGEARIERLERGIVKRHADIRRETFEDSGTLIQGTTWREKSERFTLRFDDRELRDLDRSLRATLTFSAYLEPERSVLYLDNVRIIER